MSLDRLVGIFGLLFFAAIVIRVILVYRASGHFPIIVDKSDSAHSFVHKVLAGIVILETLNVVAFRLGSLSELSGDGGNASLFQYMGPLDFLDTPSIQITGLVISYLGLLWSIIAQFQMGKDWRVGIDLEHETSLVTHGLYIISRHPIYLGFMMITTGLFLCAPSIASLVGAVLTTVILSIEARLEEEFLLARHGEQYRAYLDNTRRWI